MLDVRYSYIEYTGHTSTYTDIEVYRRASILIAKYVGDLLLINYRQLTLVIGTLDMRAVCAKNKLQMR